MTMSMLFTLYDDYISFLKIFLLPLQLIVASFHRFFKFFFVFRNSSHANSDLTVCVLPIEQHIPSISIVLSFWRASLLSLCTPTPLLTRSAAPVPF